MTNHKDLTEQLKDPEVIRKAAQQSNEEQRKVAGVCDKHRKDPNYPHCFHCLDCPYVKCEVEDSDHNQAEKPREGCPACKQPMDLKHFKFGCPKPPEPPTETSVGWDLKKWFEANYLDGDEIQDGQTLSSEECFDAIKTAQREERAKVLDELSEKLSGMEIYDSDDTSRSVINMHGYNEALTEALSIIENLKNK